MPKLINKSGEEIVRELLKIGFEIKTQKGSHIKIIRENIEGNQLVIIPNHKELKIGTLHSVYKKCREFLNDRELEDVFF